MTMHRYQRDICGPCHFSAPDLKRQVEALREALIQAAAGLAVIFNRLPCDNCEAIRRHAHDNFKAARAALDAGEIAQSKSTLENDEIALWRAGKRLDAVKLRFGRKAPHGSLASVKAEFAALDAAGKGGA